MISAHRTLLRLLLLPAAAAAAAGGGVGGSIAAANRLSAAFNRPELAARWEPAAACRERGGGGVGRVGAYIFVCREAVRTQAWYR